MMKLVDIKQIKHPIFDIQKNKIIRPCQIQLKK